MKLLTVPQHIDHESCAGTARLWSFMKARDSNLIIIAMRFRLSYDTLRHKAQLTGSHFTPPAHRTLPCAVRAPQSTRDTSSGIADTINVFTLRVQFSMRTSL